MLKTHWLKILVVAICAWALFSTVSKKYQIKDSDFVGKWVTSKTFTPIYLYPNGEWEIKKEDGNVLQYGIWHYEPGYLVWVNKQGEQLINDRNPVVAMAKNQFKVREQNGSVTVFTKQD
jgi:hypothetical protein